MEKREYKDLLTSKLSDEDNKLIFTYDLPILKEDKKKDKKCTKKEKK
jgi:hypothetical protein